MKNINSVKIINFYKSDFKQSKIFYNLLNLNKTKHKKLNTSKLYSLIFDYAIGNYFPYAKNYIYKLLSKCD